MNRQMWVNATTQRNVAPTVDILATVAALSRPPYRVGLAAESQDVEQLGEEKQRRLAQ